MRKKIIIPVILALGTACSSLAVVPAMATAAPAAVVASGHHITPKIHYYG